MSEEIRDLVEFTRHQLAMADSIAVGNQTVSVGEITSFLEPMLTASRRERLAQVVAGRTLQVCPVLENIYDLGNISAVLRSSEAFGFLRVHLVSAPGSRFKAANRVSKGTEKWLDVHVHRSAAEAAQKLKSQGYRIWATHLEASVPITEVDFTHPVAIVLGNEKDGVSQEMLDLADGRFIIPMQGFAQSFNISVAAAITFYHAWVERTRRLGQSGDLTESQRRQVLANYLLRCFDNPEALLKARNL